MILFYVGGALYIALYVDRRTANPRRNKLFFLLLPALILVAPAIPIMTVWYIGYVAIVFARRFIHIQSDFDEKDEKNFSFAGVCKLFEAVCEANLQAMLGWFTSLLTKRKADFI